jgi:hypothetical protein
MTVALDFDVPIHSYDHGWQGGKIYGQPVEGAADGIRAVMAEEATFVLTAREDLGAVAAWIEKEMGIPTIADSPITSRHFWNKRGVLLVTNKKYPARAYLDDRAVLFTKTGGWTQALQDLELDLTETIHTYLVTVKLPKNPRHNPRAKKSGPCPVNGEPCSDVTGEHHTVVMRTTHTLSWVAEEYGKEYHVTRVESMPGKIPF